MKVYEICKVSPSRTVEIRDWGPDFHEEVAVVAKAAVFEQSLLEFLSSCLAELGCLCDGELEIRENTSKKLAVRGYRLVLLTPTALNKSQVSEIRSEAKNILLSVSKGQSDWVDNQIDSQSLDSGILPQQPKQEIENLTKDFQKQFSRSKVRNTVVEFEDGNETETICVSKINSNSLTASESTELQILGAAVDGLSRTKEKLSIITEEGKTLDLQFCSPRMSEVFFGSILAGISIKKVQIEKTINRGTGRTEHYIRSAEITVWSGEILTLKS